MLWRRTAHTSLIPTTAPVPDTEALRRMLLQSSWHRGRWVARRRVALRWMLWSLRRYGLYLLLIAVAAFYLYSRRDALGSQNYLSPTTTTGPQKPSTLSTPSQDLAMAPILSPEGTVLPDTLADDAALPLRLESAWPARPSPNAPPSSQPSQAESEAELPTPPLKTENWLHSKEP